MQPTASALTQRVARLIALNKRSLASEPLAIIFASETKTFSKETSEHVWPSTVGNDVTETPSALESIITRARSSPELHETINLDAFAPLRTSAFVPLSLLSAESDVSGFV